MKFYNVSVGKETRRGHFNELHSFVCKTKNGDIGAVRKYYNSKYVGFAINVSEVVDVVDENIVVENDMFSDNKEI